MALITADDARRPPGGPDLARQARPGHLGAALIAAGLLIRSTDRAAGVVTVPADYSELGWLMLMVTGLALTVPGITTGLVKLKDLGST
jgi:hypothetical protein